MFRTCDLVEYRSVYRGRVRWAFPCQVIHDDSQQLVLYLAPGAEGVSNGSRSDAVHQLASHDWDVAEVPWHTNRVIRITPFDAAHAIELWWEHTTDRFLFWKINLQAPLRRTRSGSIPGTTCWTCG